MVIALAYLLVHGIVKKMLAAHASHPRLVNKLHVLWERPGKIVHDVTTPIRI